MQKQKGFTIIELIVVIAIIAVLAAIVLVNVTGFINKGKDAAIKGNLSSLMTDAAVVFEKNAAYNTDATNSVCGASGPWAAIKNAMIGAGSNSNLMNCGNNGTQWCACAQLVNTVGNYFCVDYTGTKKETTAANCAATTCASSFVCP